MFIALIHFIPQIHFCYQRGSDWNGSYVTVQGDEFLYSAYINSLKSAPRRNDPFAWPKPVEAESTFSIQFLPAFYPGPPSLCLLLLPLLCLAPSQRSSQRSRSTRLLSLVMSPKSAAFGAVIVLCTGTLFAGQGIVPILLGQDSEFIGLLFLRRYQPSASFFGCFCFVASYGEC